MKATLMKKFKLKHLNGDLWTKDIKYLLAQLMQI
jgi:hypothetical protein